MSHLADQLHRVIADYRAYLRCKRHLEYSREATSDVVMSKEEAGPDRGTLRYSAARNEILASLFQGDISHPSALGLDTVYLEYRLENGTSRCYYRMRPLRVRGVHNSLAEVVTIDQHA